METLASKWMLNKNVSVSFPVGIIDRKLLTRRPCWFLELRNRFLVPFLIFSIFNLLKIPSIPILFISKATMSHGWLLLVRKRLANGFLMIWPDLFTGLQSKNLNERQMGSFHLDIINFINICTRLPMIESSKSLIDAIQQTSNAGLPFSWPKMMRHKKCEQT